MARIAEGLGGRMDEIATIVTREAGMPKWLSLIVQAGLPINSFAQAGALAGSYQYEEPNGNSLIVREPVGVVGCITPWNYPLHQIAAKVAFAMAAGCTVVLKPSEVAPLDAFVLAEVINDAGLPPGVFNLVTGTGPAVGEAIAVPPRDRHGVVHRLDPRRQARRRARVAVAEARRARARRQVGEHPARRPRHGSVRPGRPRRHPEVLPELGPDLLRAHPHARAARQARRRRAHRGRRGRVEVPARRPVRRRCEPRAALVAGAGRAGQRLHPEGHRRGRQARHRRSRASPKASSRATSCSRPSSRTCRTT